MKKLSAMVLCFLLVTLLACSGMTFSAFADTDFATPQEWANGLIGDSGITITNVQGGGSINTDVTYEGAGSISSGLSLTTNSGLSSATAFGGQDICGMLADLSGYSFGGHLSYVEVELVSTGTVLSFFYAYASAEFGEAPRYNDNFGLFVSTKTDGVWSDYENIAIIPDTEMSVNIQNLKKTTGLYSSTGTITGCEHGIDQDNYTRGYTCVFKARKAVSLGQSVRILFAICDISDTAVDSAVVIRAQSLSFDAPTGTPNYLSTAKKIEYLEPDTLHRITTSDGSELLITTDANGAIPFVGTTDASTPYDLTGDTLKIERYDAETETWSKPQTGLHIQADREPEAPEELSVPTEGRFIAEPDCTSTKTSIIIGNAQTNQEYYLYDSNGNLLETKSGADGAVEFTGLTEATNYIVKTAYLPSREAPVSDYSDPAYITTKTTLQDGCVSVVDYSGTYDGEYHTAEITPSAAGLTITYFSSEDLTKPLTSKPSFKNAGYNKIYFQVSNGTDYPYCGVATVRITTDDRNLQYMFDYYEDQGELPGTVENIEGTTSLEDAIKSGKQLGTKLVVKLSTAKHGGLTDAEYAEVQAILKENTPEEMESAIVQFVDASLCIIDVDTGKVVGYIVYSYDTYECSITLGKSAQHQLKGNSGGVIQTHQGYSKTISSDYSEETGILTFNSRYFSTFTVCAVGEDIPDPIPETGDETPIMLLIALAFVSTAAIIVMLKKRQTRG